MNSDDEKRLAEIREVAVGYDEIEDPHVFLLRLYDATLAKLDELERARMQQMTDRDEWREVARDWKSRATKAEAALAEERAKREAGRAEMRSYIVAVSKAVYPGATSHPAFDSSWILTELESTLESHRERAEAAEARVRELEARIAGLEK